MFLHEKGQKDFLKTLEEVSKRIQIIYNTHLISLFDEKELDRVLLVSLNDRNKTTVRKPWTNRIEEVAAPVYHALGFDKLIFEKVKKILFVEGISDKFILEGFQRVDDTLEDWYIHPLFGGGNVGESKLIKRIKLLACLSMHENIEYYFVLDGDMRKIFEKKNENSEINPEIEKLKSKVVFLGNEMQELEDLIDKDFYLDCVYKYYQNILINDPNKLGKLRKVIEKLKTMRITSKITKEIEKKFKEEEIGRFSKVNVAILIKRKLKKGEFREDTFSDLLSDLKKLKGK